MNSITKRWLRGSMALTVLILVLAESLFLYAGRSSYYAAVRQALLNRFSSISGQLKMYGGSTVAASADNRYLALHRMVEQFDEKDKIEFMLLDSEGQVLTTSSGSLTSAADQEEDFWKALDSPSGQGESIYVTDENEKVMAVTILSPYPAGDVTALRMVTSLTLVDKALAQRAWVSLGAVLVVLGFSVYSGLYFIRSIVNPLQQVERTANQIARGDLSVRLPQSGQKDEIGRLCETINRMAEDLSKTERMKNEFISSVSHELRTPLTSIRGWVETIASIRDPQDENYQKGLAIIGAETDRLYGMVEELLDFSRLQAGIRLECQPLDLVAELTDAVLFVEPRIRQEGMRLEYEEPELPLPVWADPKRLRQVFLNILDNAVKYSAPGGVITLELLQDGENVYILFRDEGRGISPEDLENVKLKFFKGKNAVRGSGIGLAVADEIVTALNGSLDIESRLGEGTTVKVMLPLYRPGGPGKL